MAVQRRSTRQRQIVLDAVRSRCDHPTAEDIFLAVQGATEPVSRATVYRNLSLLAHEGAIQLIKTPGGNRYDRRCGPHAHVMCTSCGQVVDIDLPYRHDLDVDAAAHTDFSIRSHYTLFEGLCPTCRARAEHDA